MIPYLPRKALLGAFAVLLAVLWFGAIGERHLAHPDEGRYSEIAREMALSGDFVTPRLNGFKYFEKPPLQYWATALAFRAFGVHETSARLWTALCGGLAILATGLAGWRLFGARVGWTAVAVLAGSSYYAGLGHVVTLDMGVAAFLTLALMSMIAAQDDRTSDTHRRRWMLVTWAAMALATLSKGLIGIVIPGATLAIYLAMTRDWRLLAKLDIVRGSLLYLAIAAPWFVLVSMRNAEFAQFFFIHEHLQRYTSQVHRREEPWWYFIPIVIVGLYPWTFALPAALRRSGQDQHTFRPRLLLTIWAVFIVAFFSLSGSKLPAYVLPAFPALALLIALYLETASPRAARWLLGTVIVGSILATIAAETFKTRKEAAFYIPLFEAYEWWLIGGFATLTAAGLYAGWLLHRGRSLAAWLVVGAAGLALARAAEIGYDTLSPYKSAYEMAQAAKPFITPDTPVYSVENYDQTFPFYLGRTLTLVRYGDEFELGQKIEPDGNFIRHLDQFLVIWRKSPRGVALLHPDRYKQWVSEGKIEARLVWQDPRRIVIAKP